MNSIKLLKYISIFLLVFLAQCSFAQSKGDIKVVGESEVGIYVDGKFYGKTGKKGFHVKDLLVGEHEIKARKKDMEAGKYEIKIKKRKTLSIRVFKFRRKLFLENEGLLKFYKQFAELKTLWAHPKRVFHVTFSPDGKFLASGGKDKVVRLWSMSDFKLKKKLTGHERFVYSLSFSHDGKILASGGSDKKKTIRLWDWKKEKLIKNFVGHTWMVNTLKFSQDGKKLISGSWDKRIRIWDISTGCTIKYIYERIGWIFSIALSPDGKIFAAATGKGNTYLFDLPTIIKPQILSLLP